MRCDIISPSQGDPPDWIVLRCTLTEGDIAEVRLDIGGREVRLWGAEVYERDDGSLRVVKMDERVLVQADGRRPEATRRAEPFAPADRGR
jgi:hypothetical protein